jgi:hypothetical protein
MLSVGYQLPEAAIPEAIRAREYAERQRAPMAERFFEGRWDAPVMEV